MTVKAPQRIFVRGRGLDTEFGGKLRLTGPVSSIVASGAFQMVRGRLDILTQRIAFDRGIITFAGDLDPILDFSGSTRSGDVTITVTVSGRASDPQVTFTSIAGAAAGRDPGAPDLPEGDRRAVAAAGGAARRGGVGALGRLRRAFSAGSAPRPASTTSTSSPTRRAQTSVAAGRYVTENVYLGVQQGTTAARAASRSTSTSPRT